MKALDWLVLIVTIGGITLYGYKRVKRARDATTYFHSQTLRWPTIGLSIMATQASAITFLSTPGQGFEDGLRFVQFYFGLPLAMIVISAVFVPIYQRLRVRTAYEYLEHRFDARVRYFGAISFLIQRGLATGVSIYAPAIILSSILGWSLSLTNLGIGIVVITYTVLGGTEVVSETQKQQMIVMMLGLLLALGLTIASLPESVSLPKALHLAGALGRVNPVSFSLDFENRYNFWSGISGGFFLALSYFGTDQSQVQRYLSGKSVTEMRLGLLFNGIFKIPMQFLILFIGVMVFVFYLFVQPPLFWNQAAIARVRTDTVASSQLDQLQERHAEAWQARKSAALAYVDALDQNTALDAPKQTLQNTEAALKAVHRDTQMVVSQSLSGPEMKDTDYVFLEFVLRAVPTGLIGMLIAVIMCAAMSSTASELSALGSTTMLDLFLRFRKKPISEAQGLRLSKLFTALWGVVAIGFASFAALVDNLIEAVNILGSLFYGTTLGLFLVGFGMRWIRATPVLISACVAQALVLYLFVVSKLGFLWYNVIGSGTVVLLAVLLQLVWPKDAENSRASA
ncbi:MAG TPA: sodium:solute symporter [Polyangiales bacterium]|nr:sodium:solute symporter [Polyangiales bacterium]